MLVLPLGWRLGGMGMPGVKYLQKYKDLGPMMCWDGAEAMTHAGSKAQT